MTSRLLLSYAPRTAGLHLSGAFDTAERGALRRRFADLLALDCTEIRIDAAKVTYIDCGCLWELAKGKRDLEHAGRVVTTRSASGNFRGAALAAGYDDLMPDADGAGAREHGSSPGRNPHPAGS